MMELTEDFLKLLQIAIVVVGVLALYFSYIGYNVTVESRTAERDALIIGNSLLSSDCLTYLGTKSLFSEDKLVNVQSDPSCLQRNYPNGTIKVQLQDLSSKWQFTIGPSNLGGETKLSVAVKMSGTGEVKPANMVVKV